MASLRMKIYVAGHGGMVGTALVKAFSDSGDWEIVTRSRKELDLCEQAAVESFFSS